MKSPASSVNHFPTLKSFLIYFFISLIFSSFNITKAQSQSDVNAVIKELNGYVKEMKKAKKFALENYGHHTSSSSLEKTFAKYVNKAGAWDNYNDSWPGWLHLSLSDAGLFSRFGLYGLNNYKFLHSAFYLILESKEFVKKYGRFDKKKLTKLRISFKEWKKERAIFDKKIAELLEVWAQRSKYIEIGYRAPYTEAGKKIRAEAEKTEAKYSAIGVGLKAELLKHTKMPPFESLVQKVYLFKNIIFYGGPLESQIRFLKDQIDVRIKNYIEYDNKTGGELKARIHAISKKQYKLIAKAKKLSNDLKKKAEEILSAKKVKITPKVKAFIDSRKLSLQVLAELENKIIESSKKGRHSENTKRFKKRDEILKYTDKLYTLIKANTQDDAQFKLLEKLNNEYLRIDEALWNIKKEQYKIDSEEDLVFYSYDKYREELGNRIEAIDFAKDKLNQIILSTSSSKVKYIFIGAKKAKILQATATPGLVNEYNRFKTLIKKIEKMKKNAEIIKDKTKNDLISANVDAKIARKAMEGWRGLIMKRALTNAAMDLGKNFYDVYIEGGKKGAPGIVAALAGKTAAFLWDWSSGKLTKDDIDYKSIMERAKKNVASESKIIITSATATGEHILKELLKTKGIKGIEGYTNDLVYIALTLDSSSTQATIKKYKKIVTDLNEKGFAHLKDLAEEKYAAIKENAKKLWAKRNNSLQEIKKDIEQIKIGDKSIKEFTNELAISASVEFIKAGISQQLKQNEINGWQEMFEKDLKVVMLGRVAQDASTRFFKISDLLLKTRRDLFKLTNGREMIDLFLIDYNNAFFETDLLKLQIQSGNMKDVNQRVYIDKVEATKINSHNYTFDTKNLGKDAPNKVDLKIVFEAKR